MKIQEEHNCDEKFFLRRRKLSARTNDNGKDDQQARSTDKTDQQAR